MLSDFVIPGKVSIIIDGQFGSTGKGLIASKISLENNIDICGASLSPNAGHTFYNYEHKKCITKLLPVTGIMSDYSTIYLSPECVINEELLLDEIEKYNVNPERIYIHPRASVVETTPDNYDKGLISIGSTRQGTGPARASKILRKNKLIGSSEKLKDYINIKNLDMNFYLEQGCSILLETGQGVDLGLNYGLSYPYCTNRDVLPASILADFGIHPKYLGNVILTFRTYPIRVGNPLDENKNEIGYSGPFYNDSTEITWNQLNKIPELTTVTNRIRRVATFSIKQFEHSMNLVQPTHIFLNFINYLDENSYKMFNTLLNSRKEKIYLGYGPFNETISFFEKNSLENYIFKFKN